MAAVEPDEVIPAEYAIDSGSTQLVLRNPQVPVTIDQLAALKVAGALEVLDARVLVLEIARKKAIRMTHPPDWVLFRTPDGVETGYLQDAGCDRIRDILGIEVFNVSKTERIASADGQSFVCVVRGDGRSRLTLQTVVEMVGGRSSDEEYAKGKTGAALELSIEKAARANLDGGITRELAGLRNVPIEELRAAWEGTAKRVEQCRKGRGYGSGNQRYGQAVDDLDNVPAPTCTICKGADGKPLPLTLRRNSKTPFWGCSNYSKHANDRSMNKDAAAWAAEHRPAASAAAPTFARNDERQPGEDD